MPLRSDEPPTNPSLLLLFLVPHQHKPKIAEDLFKEYQQQLGTKVKEEQNEKEIEICPLRFYYLVMQDILLQPQKHYRPLNRISLIIKGLTAYGNLTVLWR